MRFSVFLGPTKISKDFPQVRLIGSQGPVFTHSQTEWFGTKRLFCQELYFFKSYNNKTRPFSIICLFSKFIDSIFCEASPSLELTLCHVVPCVLYSAWFQWQLCG